MVFIRKITDSKWEDNYDEKKDVHAECLKDLKTTDNKLSVWDFQTDEDIKRVVALLAVNGDNEPPANARVVLFTDEDLKNRNISFEKTKHCNPISINVSTANHYDLYELKVGSICDFARLIAKKYADSSNVRVVKKAEIIDILANSAINNEFDVESIKSDSFKSRIKKAINARL